MTTKRTITGAILASGLFAAGVLAQQGADEYHHRHPNLVEAERLTAEAAQHVKSAQEANEFDLGGHAQAARVHLSEANKQLGLAARFINQHPEKKER